MQKTTHVELFRGWQSTQTQSSVRTLRSLRQQMDVWFCLMQESSAERHCCVTADPDQANCAPFGARPEILCFSLDFDLHGRGQPDRDFWIIRQHLVNRSGSSQFGSTSHQSMLIDEEVHLYGCASTKVRFHIPRPESFLFCDNPADRNLN